MIRLVGVVVPARDEGDTLGRCLSAIDRTAARLAEVDDAPEVVVTVACDAWDATSIGAMGRFAADARFRLRPRLVPTRTVGAARAAGVRAVLATARARGLRPADVWLANTDADSEVPADWLPTHLELAATGAVGVVGLVRVSDWSGQAAAVRRAWEAAYVVSDDHPHVHGTNLGVRGDAYLAAGGFADVPLHEDVELVRALAHHGTVLRTARARVTTSARGDNRVPGGFGGHLRDLAS